MNAHATPHKPLPVHIAAILRRIDIEDADNWARIAMCARMIPADVDLDDDMDVMRALFAARFCTQDFADCLDEIIDRAWMIRESGQ